jgi:hypothetical protein
LDRPLSSLLQDLRLPGHRQMAEHWLDLYGRAGHRLPALGDLDATRFPKALNDSWIVDAEDDGRFRMRLAGEGLVQWYGFNPKGRYYEDIFPATVLPVVTAQSRRVLQGPCIGYHHMHSTIPDWTVPAAFERLALPLADAQGRCRHILGATLFKGQNDLGRGVEATFVDADHWYSLTAA